MIIPNAPQQPSRRVLSVRMGQGEAADMDIHGCVAHSRSNSIEAYCRSVLKRHRPRCNLTYQDEQNMLSNECSSLR